MSFHLFIDIFFKYYGMRYMVRKFTMRGELILTYCEKINAKKLNVSRWCTHPSTSFPVQLLFRPHNTPLSRKASHSFYIFNPKLLYCFVSFRFVSSRGSQTVHVSLYWQSTELFTSIAENLKVKGTAMGDRINTFVTATFVALAGLCCIQPISGKKERYRPDIVLFSKWHLLLLLTPNNMHSAASC